MRPPDGPDDDTLAALGRGLPEHQPTPRRRDETRARTLAAAALAGRPASPTRWWIAAAVAAGAALIALGSDRLIAPPDEGRAARAVTNVAAPPAAPAVALSRASIDARGGAAFFRERPPPHEVIRLVEGTIRLDVSPLRAGESLRVVAEGGVVEVRGTVFEVTASARRLLGVRVDHGRVAVRTDSGGEVVLTPGRTWSAAAPASPTPRARPVAFAPPPAALPPAPSLPSRPTADPSAARAAGGCPAPRSEAAFSTGLHALRAGDAASAARAFASAAALAGNCPIAEDAAYWHAVALARAGGRDDARAALEAFLTRFPGAARASDASVMLGWQLLAMGDRTGAEARFRAALADRSARVRAGARAGLAAIGQ